MKKVALHNLGCKVNAYELEVIQQMLTENGYEIVSFVAKADIYIVNTCTVTNMADRKSRQMLHRAKKMNPNATVIAMGCYAQTGKAEALGDASIDLIIGNNKKKDLIDILKAYENPEYADMPEEERKTLKNQTMIDINHTDEYEELHLEKTAEHTRAYIKIQDGCNQFCSYCIIPFARGRVRSRDSFNILEEVRRLSKNGYQEIVLTGIHISSYGIDLKEEQGKAEENLLSLIKKIHEIEGIMRIRLGSLEPRIITEEFITEIKRLDKICPHFHLSLQSGCDTTLRRMNRQYITDEYYEKVVLLRKNFINPAITTDIIVGFPGETESEFAETIAFIKKIKFFETHIFKYSKRTGTRAAEMSNQIPEQIKSERSSMLIQLNHENAREYKKLFLNKTVEVLFEEAAEINGIIYQTGHTREYIKVAINSSKKYCNNIQKGKLIHFVTQEILEFSGNME